MTVDRAIDAFIDGRLDFEMFRQTLEEQLAQYPAEAAPAIARLEAFRTAGRLSAAMHAVIYDEVKRGARGDITASIEGRDDAADAAPPARDTVPEASVKAVPVLTRIREAPSPPAVIPGVGTVLAGRYRLEALLERGGMSQVFRAGDLRRSARGSSPAKVGVKLARAEPAARKALEHEATLLAELSHPGVVRMLDFDHEGGSAFMVMELLEGERLRSRLVRSQPELLPETEALGLIRELADVLAYLHAHDLVHRDIKPANIFITTSGEFRLIDFGLAASTGAAHPLGAETPKAWTPLYASPQMLAGDAPDPRDDVYSLGCVAYEMLAGRHPWGNVPAPEARVRKLRLSRPAGLARQRWITLRRSLSFRAADRPADGGAFLYAFFPPVRRRRLLPWVAASFVAGIAIGMVLQVERAEPPASGAPAITQAPVEAPVPVMTPPLVQEGGDAEESLPVTVPPAAEEARQSEAPQQAEQPLQSEAPLAEAPEPVEAPAVAPAAPAAAAAPAPATFSLAANRFRVAEGAGALRLEMRRPAGYRGPLSVHWRTVDETARDGVNFSGSTGWQWAGTLPDAPSLVIFIPIVDDSRPGPDVTFRVELEQVPEGPAIGAPTAAQVTISDDD